MTIHFAFFDIAVISILCFCYTIIEYPIGYFKEIFIENRRFLWYTSRRRKTF